MHTQKTKEKMQDSARKVWQTRTPEQKNSTKAKLGAISSARWRVRKAMACDSPICLKCVFFTDEADHVAGICCRHAPPFPPTTADQYCGDFVLVFAEHIPAKNPATVIAETDPRICEYRSSFGVCDTDDPCAYKKTDWMCARKPSDIVERASDRASNDGGGK